MDQRGHKVKNICSAKIPAGTIKNNCVVEQKVLAKIISDIWDKTKIKEKFVSLIIPEYSTFIKTINLPDLNISEINEALSFELQEILPTPLDKTVVDWKIIGKNEKGYEILVVSVEKSILDSYLSPVEDSGLLPLIVEIPSVSLSKLIESKDDTQILIYVGNSESVFVFQSEGKLLGSSIVLDDNGNEIIKTAKRMMLHYEKYKPSKILLAGKINDSLKNGLCEISKIPVELIDNVFPGVEESVIKEYLIPVSSQMQTPNVPEDPFSINLLPDNFVVEYKNIQARLQIWSLTLASSLFVWIAFLGVLFSYLLTNDNLKCAKSTLANTPVDKNSIQETINRINTVNDLSLKITKTRPEIEPINLINQIFLSKPEGLIITSYDIDFEKGLGLITGSAVERSAMVEFRNKLEELENISSVDLPVSSFELTQNPEFKINFVISNSDKQKK